MFSKIDLAIDFLKKGKLIIVTDDEERENEGDFVGSAEMCTLEMINFMINEGRGMLCTPLTESRALELNLELMSPVNTSLHQTPFTILIDYIHGTTTGISAADRSATVKAIADPNSKPTDFGRPGHIAPLRAVEEGVLRRAGHTEAAVDLMKLSGLYPVGVLCEILKDDGTMARFPDLLELSKKFEMPIVTIKDLIAYKLTKEKLVKKIVEVDLPTDYGDFKLHLYHNLLDNKEHLALVKGDITTNEPVLVRVHSECFTGDTLGSKRCDCQSQLHTSMCYVEQEGRGVVLYMRQEGRGIGLTNKLLAYALQDQGKDTVEANEALGFKADLRDYGLGAQILSDLGIKEMKLITNNPKKIIGLESYGLKVVERIPLEVGHNDSNFKYLKTKKDKLGHLFS